MGIPKQLSDDESENTSENMSESSELESEIISEKQVKSTKKTKSKSSPVEAENADESQEDQIPCKFCSETFEDTKHLGLHIAHKHRKENKKLKQAMAEQKRTGMDKIVEVTNGVPQKEYIAQNGEEGFFALKEAMFDVALDSVNVSPETKEAALMQYKLNPAISRDFNRMSEALTGLGVNQHRVRLVMDIMMGWEQTAITALDESMGRGPRTYYSPLRGPGNQGGMYGVGYGAGQQYGQGFMSPSGYMTGGQPYQPGSMMPGMPPGMMPGQSMSYSEMLSAMDRKLDDRKKKDELSELDKKVDTLGDMMMKFFEGKLKPKGQSVEEVRYCEYETPLIDPTTGGVLLNKDGDPIMRMMRVPEDRMPSIDSMPSGRDRQMEKLEDKIERLMEKPREDPLVQEMREENKEIKKMMADQKDLFNSKQVEALEKRMDENNKIMANMGANMGEWKSDMARMVSGSIKEMGDIMKSREPFRDWAGKMFLGTRTGQKVFKTGPNDVVNSFEDSEELPVVHRPKQQHG